MGDCQFHKIWIEQCAGAKDIQDASGTEKALGYLIGEKLLNFVRASDTHKEFAEELPKFVAEIKRIFQSWEINHYLENVKRVGAMGHVCDEDEEYEAMKNAGMIEDGPVTGAENAILFERAKELLC